MNRIGKIKHFIFFIGIFCLACFIYPQKANAAPQTYDLATTTNYNIEYKGPSYNSGFTWSRGGIQYADLNGNGKKDLIIASYGTAYYMGYANSGSLYIIYDSLLEQITGKGNLIDLSNSSNWNIRFDGTSVNEEFAQTLPVFTDLNNDNKLDLVVQAWSDFNGRGDSGSVYVVYNELFSGLTGTGNVLNMATASNYNIRFDGALAGDLIGYNGLTENKDLNNNGKNDLLITSYRSDNNSRVNSGSVYLFYDNLLSTFTGTGNNVDLSNSANYSVRIDGAVADSYLGLNAQEIADVNTDGKNDLILGAPYADYNSRADSGSVYVIYNSIFGSKTGTGNLIDLATTSNWNIRYDGSTASSIFGYGLYAIKDLNSNNKKDLLFPESGSSKSIYAIYDSLIDDYSGTGNIIDLATSTNYSFNINGQASALIISLPTGLQVGDYNGDGKVDILAGAQGSGYNSKSSSGSVYIFFNSLFGSFTGTGNSLSVQDSSNFSVRYDGKAVDDIISWNNNIQFVDINNDGRLDVSFGSFRPNGRFGGLYIIYNYPHTLTLDSYNSSISSGSIDLTGNVTATNSVTNIAGVQWSYSNNPLGSWNECDADDATFDSTNEDFTCSLTGLSEGTYNVYIRTYDTNSSYTYSSNYKHATFAYDTQAPSSGSISINNGATYTSSKNVTLTIIGTDAVSGVTQMMISNSSGFSGASWESYATSKAWSLTSGDGTKTVYIKFKDGVGNESSTYSDSIILDTTYPTIDNVSVDDEDVSAVDTTVTIIGDDSVVIAGQTNPNTAVTISVQQLGLTCTTESDEEGNFSCNFDNLSNGSYAVVVTATNESGNSTTYSFVLGIGTTLPDTSVKSLVVVLGLLVFGFALAQVWYLRLNSTKL